MLSLWTSVLLLQEDVVYNDFLYFVQSFEYYSVEKYNKIYLCYWRGLKLITLRKEQLIEEKVVKRPFLEHHSQFSRQRAH